MDEAHERVLGWYKQGRYAFQLGRRYEPPDDMVLRKCYAAGWEDEINDHYPEGDHALDGVYEQLKTYDISEGGIESV